MMKALVLEEYNKLVYKDETSKEAEVRIPSKIEKREDLISEIVNRAKNADVDQPTKNYLAKSQSNISK